jgi:hypothetical protein
MILLPETISRREGLLLTTVVNISINQLLYIMITTTR